MAESNEVMARIIIILGYGEQPKANVSVVTLIPLALIGFEIKPSVFIAYVGFGTVLRTGRVLPAES